MTKVLPPRFPWHDFPDVVLHSPESAVKKHPRYLSAKTGSIEDAELLCDDVVSDKALATLRMLPQLQDVTLVAAHAYEAEGVNALPFAAALKLSEQLKLEFETEIVQTNAVRHTGADGFSRLARQASFDGTVVSSKSYLIVDDFVGQGGTIANLRGYLISQGGIGVAATALTGKSYSAILNASREQIERLRAKHGQELERWWQDRFGHTFDCLTQSEARYLERSPSADAIRDRIVAAEQT
jgi:adenine/guanine phosphoribosyltransferase-like PRPP-binding protein